MAFSDGSESISGPMSDFTNPVENPITKAIRLVTNTVNRDHSWTGHEKSYEVYVVLFAYVLGGWKATLSTNLPDDMYYEVTYNVAKSETYVDSYLKTKNEVISDMPAEKGRAAAKAVRDNCDICRTNGCVEGKLVSCPCCQNEHISVMADDREPMVVKFGCSFCAYYRCEYATDNNIDCPCCRRGHNKTGEVV